MKTIKIISSLLMALIFSNFTMAQVDTEPEFNTSEKMSTASLMNPDLTSNLEDEVPPTQQVDVPSITGFHIGLKYLPIFSNLDFATANGQISADGTVNHGFGISFNYYFTNFFGTHLEINNTRLEYNFQENNTTTKVNINYINIPLLASYNTNYGRTINWNLSAGPYVGINTGADISSSGTNGQNGTTTATGVINVRPADIGLAYGTGIDIGIGQTKWLHVRVGYRGTAGLVELTDNEADVNPDQFNVVLSRSKLVTNGGYIGLMFKL